MLQTAIEMPLYFQNDDQRDHILRQVIVDNRLWVGDVNGASLLQKTLEWRASKNYSVKTIPWLEKCGGLAHLKCSCTPMR